MQPKRHFAALMVPTSLDPGCYRTNATLVSEELVMQHIGIDLTHDYFFIDVSSCKLFIFC